MCLKFKLFSSFVLLTASLFSQNIFTSAGSGSVGFSGDGGPAVLSKIYYPSSVACDNMGNCYIADAVNYRIRKVNAAGIISTFAGTGVNGHSGDGGPAISANLYVNTLLCGQDGSVYFTEGNRIRKISPGGIISTISGTNIGGYNGDNILATGALLNSPEGLVMDAQGNLYIADKNNNRIRKINTAGIITTVGGDGGSTNNSSLPMPMGVAVDAQQNLYVCGGFLNSGIKKIDSGGNISLYQSAIYQNSLILFQCTGLVLDAQNNLYVSDVDKHRVWKVTPLGVVTLIAGSNTIGGNLGDGGPAVQASLNYPVSIALGNGMLYICDKDHHRIRVICDFNECAVGLKDADYTTSSVSLYPNPSHHYILVRVPENYNNSMLGIYNSVGQLILEKGIHGFENKVDINGLEPGIYVYTLHSENRLIQNGKLIVD